MAKDRLRRLKREELLEMLLEQGRENERLQKEIETLKEQLAQRQLLTSEAGNLAEASLRISGVMEAAQAAADQYLENIRRVGRELEQKQEQELWERRDEAERETRERCREIARQIIEQCRIREEETIRRCEQMEQEARERSRETGTAGAGQSEE